MLLQFSRTPCGAWDCQCFCDRLPFLFSYVSSFLSFLSYEPKSSGGIKETKRNGKLVFFFFMYNNEIMKRGAGQRYTSLSPSQDAY